MNDFQRLLERERQLAQGRTDKAPQSGPAIVAEPAPHIRVESWRESAADDLEYINDVRVPVLATKRTPELSKSAQLAARGLEKSYYKGQVEIPVLRGVDLEVQT